MFLSASQLMNYSLKYSCQCCHFHHTLQNLYKAVMEDTAVASCGIGNSLHWDHKPTETWADDKCIIEIL